MDENHNTIPDEFLELKESRTRLSYAGGENIFKQGAFSPYVLYIINGLARTYVATGQGKQVNLRIAKAGEFLGLSAVFGESHYLTSAIALKDTLVCMINKDSFGSLLKDHNEFAMQLIAQNFLNEHRMIEIIRSLNYNQMRGKLASAILYLSDEKFLNEEVFQLLTRQDIADFASISLESSVRFLKEFDKENIISLDGREIVISDREKLKSISASG